MELTQLSCDLLALFIPYASNLVTQIYVYIYIYFRLNLAVLPVTAFNRWLPCRSSKAAACN